MLIQDFDHQFPGAINPVFWSIAVECQIYFLFPALLWLWRRYHPAFAAAVVTALSVSLMIALDFTWIGSTPGYPIVAFAPQFIGLFSLGMLAASITSDDAPRWRVWRWARGHLAAEALIVATMSGLIVASRAWPVAKCDPLVGVFAATLLVAGSRQGAGWRNPVRAALEWRPLVWIGGFSYSLYLIHTPLIQVIWQYVLHPLRLSDMTTYLLLLLVGGPLIIMAAWGFYWVAERPFLNRRPGHLAHEQLSPVAVPEAAGQEVAG